MTSGSLGCESRLARKCQCLLQTRRFGLCHFASVVGEAVIAAPLIVVFRMGSLIEFDDEALLEQPADGCVECAGVQLPAATGTCCDVLHDPVSVAITVSQRNEDMKCSGRQRK